MLYIAKCRVTQTPYMNNSQHYTKTHLVEADDERAAIQKIERYYAAKNDAYAVSYSVDVEDIEETIQ